MDNYCYLFTNTHVCYLPSCLKQLTEELLQFDDDRDWPWPENIGCRSNRWLPSNVSYSQGTFWWWSHVSRMIRLKVASVCRKEMTGLVILKISPLPFSENIGWTALILAWKSCVSCQAVQWYQLLRYNLLSVLDIFQNMFFTLFFILTLTLKILLQNYPLHILGHSEIENNTCLCRNWLTLEGNGSQSLR